MVDARETGRDMNDASDVARLRVGVIGAGAVGNALLAALAVRGAAAGMTAVAVASRTFTHARAAAATHAPGCAALASLDALAARCDLVFIATPDDAIGSVAEGVAWRPGQAVAHFSGAQGVAPLAAAAARGALVAALHPLMTFPQALRNADADQILTRLAGTSWALECADAGLAAQLRAFIAALDGSVIALTEDDRAPYHLSGVLASNYVVTLMGAATDLWAGWGIGRAEALRALLPLLRATIENLEAVGLPAALTGPIARGDAGAVRIHEAWLRTHATETLTETRDDGQTLREAYEALARLTIPLAREKGALDAEAAEELRRALDEG
jgi:predicted short-subunit dehydrogenase-like oxidoreductase (DUF2520 family)